ncbi:fasciclin-1-like [Oppia nitens]|uniref:fasciclin-1-like n=1 Tax=Oppia nitens TaxID=1686743 RepID=UPI0023D9A7DD|nr:fasciclin-1-like [Oppia nitens]
MCKSLSTKMYLAKFAILFTYCWTSISATNIYEQLSIEADLTKFKEVVDRDPVMQLFLKHKSATLFAPTNSAIEKLQTKSLRREVLDKLASYHIVGVVVKKDSFPYSVSSSLQEAAPLYLSFKERSSVGHHEYFHQDSKEFFVNNAKIVKEISLKAINGDEQLLYIIDEALEPFIPSTPLPPFALELISQPSIYSIDERWDSYYNKITSNSQEAIFERPGNHTFFVPMQDVRPDLFDKYVVLGHVIPNHVLFLNVMGKESYRSSASDQIVNVELSLINRTLRINPEQTYYVQSNTIKADPKHNKGVVISRVLRANIPVKNGVVHLIEKPLMIIDTSIIDFLSQERDGRLKTFNRLLDMVPEIRSEIAGLDQKTVLAPTDAAFNNLNENEEDDKLKYLMDNPDQLRQILQLHVVPRQSVSTEDIRRGTKPEVVSLDNNKNLHFRVSGDDAHTRMTVEGGGVNATAVQADIGATNGIIHIIDRVLGMPFQNIFDKLKSDPQLSFSFELGRQGNQNWNEQLLREDRRFTYFVPSNDAWDQFKRENPSEYKQLEMKLFPSNTRNVLDRHLVVGQQISSQQLETQFETIHTVKGVLKVAKGQVGFGNLYIEWEGRRARIVRSDVQAINGVIHVIDQVLMKKRDLTVNSSQHSIASITLTALFIIIAKFIIN